MTGFAFKPEKAIAHLSAADPALATIIEAVGPFRMELKVSRSLRATLRKGIYEVRINTAFREVVTACAKTPRPDQEGTWIQPEVIDAYMGHVMAYAEEAVRRLIGRLSDGQFRYGDRAGEWGVDHYNPFGFGIHMLDIVESGTAAHDHLEVGTNIDQRLVDFGSRTNNHAVIVRQYGHEFCGGDIITHIYDQSRLSHLLDIYVFDFVTNQYLHFLFSFIQCDCSPIKPWDSCSKIDQTPQSYSV